MNRLSKSIIFLSLWNAAGNAALAHACDFCMLGQGVNPYLISSGKGLTLDVNYTESDTVYDKTNSVLSGAKKEGWLVYSLTGFYSVTDDLSILLTVPYTEKSNLDYDVPTNTTPGVMTNGIGDLTLSARYTLLTAHTLESTLTAGLIGGVKFPTGSTQLRDYAGNPVDRHALPGTGSFDFPVGFTANYSFAGRYLLTVDGVYSFNTDGNWAGDPHRFGNSFNSSIRGLYRILPSRPEEKTLFAMAGLSSDTTGKEQGVRGDSGYGQVTNQSTGGTVLFWDLGVYSNLSASTIFSARFSKAFYHDMNYDPTYDADPAENYKLDFLITYLF